MFKPWTQKNLPKKILAIRLQALGDTFIALSYLQYLRETLPLETEIDFLVRDEFSNLPSNLVLFNTVYSLKGGNKLRHQFLGLLPHLLNMRRKKYDVVLDLQNNELSNFVRRIIHPKCYVRFDRYSAKHACARNIETINKAGFISVKEGYDYQFRDPGKGKKVLSENGLLKGEKLVLLNPAGALVNRNWPVENYIALAQLLLKNSDEPLKFLLLGTDRLLDKASEIKKALNDKVIVLINKTSIIDAFAIMQEIDLCITEDGALMHMAYLSEKKTIGLLGSTRSDWVDPKLPHTFCFTSDDMECGNCMLAECKFGTNACMTRVSPEQVYEKAINLLKRKANA